jgi:hypothetical protein
MAYWHTQDQEPLKQPFIFRYYWHSGSGSGASSCWHINTNSRILQERHILRYYWPRFRYFLCTASYAVHSRFLKRFLSCLTPCTRSGSCGSFGFLHSKQLSLRNSGCWALVEGLSQCVHDWQCDLDQLTALGFMREGLRLFKNGKQTPLLCGTPQSSDKRHRTLFMRNSLLPCCWCKFCYF